jgi:hypothetical protein
MNNSDVFQKSDLGRAEIKNQDLGMLPREARTLLILIDGNKPYQRYFESLNKSKMFIEVGGIAPFFELLQDLQYIELVEQGEAVSLEQTAIPPKPVRAPLSNDDAKAAQSPPSQPIPSRAPSSPQRSSEAEFDSTFNSNEPNQAPAVANPFKPESAAVSYETIKSDLATYIEKNAPSQDAWGYLLNLEQCAGPLELLALVQKIQSATGGSLARDMDEFSKTIKRQL